MITSVQNIIKPDSLSQQIRCNNGAFYFPNEIFPEKFVSRPIRVIASCIRTVYHFTRNLHAHTRFYLTKAGGRKRGLGGGS